MTADAVDEWLPLVRSIAHRQVMLARSYEFDDRVQDGMIAVWRALKSYDATRGVPLRAWVAMKVKRYMLDGSLRESRNRVVYLEDLGSTADSDHEVPWIPRQLCTDPIEDAYEALEDVELKARVRAAIPEVRNGDLLLEHMGGKKMRAIGEELGIAECSVSLRLKTARNQLAALFAVKEAA
jgi:RNA polymerase sigma factor (sigma-70 family)